MKFHKVLGSSFVILSLLMSSASGIYAEEATSTTTTPSTSLTETSSSLTTTPNTETSQSKPTADSTQTSSSSASSSVQASTGQSSSTLPESSSASRPEASTPSSSQEAKLAAKVNPIHLAVDRYSNYSGNYVELYANIDWDPQNYSGSYEVVDSKGRYITGDSYFDISGLSESGSFRVSNFQDGVYTVIVRGETDYQDNNQVFKGKVSFEIKNWKYYRTVETPSNIKDLETSIDYVNVGVNPIHLAVGRYSNYSGNYVELYGKIDWNPYSYTGEYRVYDSQKRRMTEGDFNFGGLSADTSFQVSEFPNGIYTVVVTGVTGGSNKNQKFRGTVAFEIKNGSFERKVEVPDGFESGVNSIQTVQRTVKSGTIPSFPSTLKVSWLDGSTSNEKVTWANANYYNKTNKAKTIKVTGTVANTTAKATATVTIHGITKVADTKTTVKTGNTPGLPKTVKVTWSDGSTSYESVNWGNLKKATFTSSKQKVVTLYGTLAKTNLKAKATVTVKVIKSLKDAYRTTKSGQAPQLPRTIVAVWSDNSTSNEKVTWNKLRNTDYTSINGKAKTTTVLGKVAGTSLKAKLRTSVLVVTKISSPTVTTSTKVYPNLPSKVTVTWSNKSTSSEKVVWNKLKASDYTLTSGNSKTVKVTGKVTSVSPNKTVTATVKVVKVIPTNIMYRLYNPNSGEHFYTKNASEKDHLASIGWKYEGIAWYAPTSGNPVYRLYNPNSGDHHYTLSKSENDGLVRLGWKAEGIAWYSGGSKPLYRLYNPNAKKAGSHHYTMNKGESDGLVVIGWKFEGIGWYAVK